MAWHYFPFQWHRRNVVQADRQAFLGNTVPTHSGLAWPRAVGEKDTGSQPTSRLLGLTSLSLSSDIRMFFCEMNGVRALYCVLNYNLFRQLRKL
jgi:hypothetical protein